MSSKITVETINAMSDNDVRNLEVNAWSHEGDEALELREKLKASGRLTSNGGRGVGISPGHPHVTEIRRLCRTPEWIALAVHAINAGKAPMEVIDPKIQQEIGDWYHWRFDAGKEAGFALYEVLLGEGYETNGEEAQLPKACVARTGKKYRRLS